MKVSDLVDKLHKLSDEFLKLGLTPEIKIELEASEFDRLDYLLLHTCFKYTEKNEAKNDPWCIKLNTSVGTIYINPKPRKL